MTEEGKEREIEIEVDDIDDILFGSEGDSEDFGDSILTDEVKEVIKPTPKKVVKKTVVKKTTKKTAKKKTIKSQPKPPRVVPNPDAEPDVKPEIKPMSDPIPSEPTLPKDKFVDEFYKKTAPKNPVDGGPLATETHEASGHLRRNRKNMRLFP